ncbi:gamma-glutamyl phosphate reductase [Lentinula aciculospora]|uniref:glutamate-5-semialdehyde dehydrogenase n=1 Tax=Lentinula aciculospora TaxID=153920 RepID=A0A9W9DJK2_9AGAR|nr:gamma-glutamyl phosphate reductase [Lentinula aciculospora]
MSKFNAHDIAAAAKTAFQEAQTLPSTERIVALHEILKSLNASKTEILLANEEDMRAAEAEVKAGNMSETLLKRLDLNRGDKWDSMLQGILDVAALPDPTGNVSYASELDDELELFRVACPIGVLLVIFEARPEVVVNIASLAIKSGNAAILKGGKESNRTTSLLAKAISAGLSKTLIPELYIQAIQTRAEVSSLLQLDQFIDLVIPRGSNSLVKNIQNNTRIPVMGHADGLCSVFIDEQADVTKAVRVVLDSKTDYPAACNASETLILHESVVHTVWPAVAKALLEANVQLLCDPASLDALKKVTPKPTNLTKLVSPSEPSSYNTEHLDLILSVVVLPSIQSAIQFINSHSSHHTDAIVTESDIAASTFCRGVDSAGTFVNASTRFADGFRYGFGTEVGISNGRIHARGPVGLDGLVTYKYMMRSKAPSGHIVGEFGTGKKQYKHKPINVASVPFL